MKWEYRFEHFPRLNTPEFVEELNRFGEEGWELCGHEGSVIRIPDQPVTYGTFAIFKRPKARDDADQKPREQPHGPMW